MIKLPATEDGEWVEINGDDFEDQERSDGSKFHASAEIRQTTPSGWISTYYAVIDVDGEWDDDAEFEDPDDDED